MDVLGIEYIKSETQVKRTILDSITFFIMILLIFSSPEIFTIIECERATYPLVIQLRIAKATKLRLSLLSYFLFTFF